MGGHDRCCVAGCNNDKRHPEKIVRRGHVQGKLIFHAFPINRKRLRHWISQVSKGWRHFEWGIQSRICSNHFLDGKPTSENSFPTLFLCERDFDESSPCKRPKTERELLQPRCKTQPKQLSDVHPSTDQITQINLNIGLQHSKTLSATF